MKYCSQCSASVESDAAFCSACGASLKAAGTRPGGFWKGVAAAVVGVTALVGLFWMTMGANSADPDRARPIASASEIETEDPPDAHASEDGNDVAARENVVVEEPGFVGRLLGEKPRVFVTVSEGERFELELQESISTESARTGDSFTARLAKPVLVEGREALPKGTVVSGHVSHAARSDKVKGRAELTLELDSLELANGEQHQFEAVPLRFEARSTTKEDAIKIGGASGVGALVGGIVGGKKGAAIGAGVGAGAGTGAVLATRGEEVVLAEGATLSTELRSDVTVELVEEESDEP